MIISIYTMLEVYHMIKHSQNVALIHSNLERRSSNYIYIYIYIYIGATNQGGFIFESNHNMDQFSTLLFTVYQWLILKTPYKALRVICGVSIENILQKNWLHCNRPHWMVSAYDPKKACGKWVYVNQKIARRMESISDNMYNRFAILSFIVII